MFNILSILCIGIHTLNIRPAMRLPMLRTNTRTRIPHHICAARISANLMESVHTTSSVSEIIRMCLCTDTNAPPCANGAQVNNRRHEKKTHTHESRVFICCTQLHFAHVCVTDALGRSIRRVIAEGEDAGGGGGVDGVGDGLLFFSSRAHSRRSAPLPQPHYK